MPAAFPGPTARLRFRRWFEGDLALALSLWGDPAVTRLIDARGPLSPAQVADRLRQELEYDRLYGYQYWPILTGSSLLVGCCGLRPYRPAEQVAELGVHIRPAYWRQGYALEAARAVIDHAFNELGLRGLFAGHHPDNTASRGLLERLGFRYTHDEPYPATGREHPSYLLGPTSHVPPAGNQ